MKTYMAKASEIKKNHYVVDANGLVLGRMATEIAKLLRGKHKPTYTPNMDCGDDIIVINAEKVKLTGKKNANKTYYRHTGYPGGLKSQKVSNILEGKNLTLTQICNVVYYLCEEGFMPDDDKPLKIILIPNK